MLSCEDAASRIEDETFAVAEPRDEALGGGEFLATPIGVVAPGASAGLKLYALLVGSANELLGVAAACRIVP